MFKKKSLKDQQILVLVRLINASKKTLVFLALLGQLWNIFPWSILQVKAETVSNQDTTFEQEVIDKYPTTTDPDFDQSQVAIETEMINERTATSKTFRKIDGTYEVSMYKEVIHYQKDGKWEDIDNSSINRDDILENNENSFKVKFPKKLDDGKNIKMTFDKYGIDWNIININQSDAIYTQEQQKSNNVKELININQSVIYKNIQFLADIEYVISGNKVKENIILNLVLL